MLDMIVMQKISNFRYDSYSLELRSKLRKFILMIVAGEESKFLLSGPVGLTKFQGPAKLKYPGLIVLILPKLCYFPIFLSFLLGVFMETAVTHCNKGPIYLPR